MLEELTAVLDGLCGEDASALADGESMVELYRCLSRLEAVATRASAAFDAGGQWALGGARSAPAWLAVSTKATRRAVQAMFPECFNRYCDVPAERCEIDHIEPYGAGGLTVSTNGRPGCGFHNRWRHRGPGPPDRE